MLDRHAAATSLGDKELVNELHRLVREDRRLTARMLAHIAEVDARKLYLNHACSSMFAYCVERLRMSAQQAYRRIHAARVGRRYPRILEMVARNELHLAGIALLSQHLTPANHHRLLDASVHQTKRQIERLLAEWFPQPDAPAVVRRLPRVAVPQGQSVANGSRAESQAGSEAESQAGSQAGFSGESRSAAKSQSPVPVESRAQSPAAIAAPAGLQGNAGRRPDRRSMVKPTAPDRYKIQFTASAALHRKLREAQDLLGHRVPNGDLAEIFERALDALLAGSKNKRLGATDRPREQKASTRASRHIPNAVKRTVVERDGGRCTFVDADGHRCTATAMIEFHHIDAYARGGAHTVDNITLRCAPHNRFAAEQELERAVVEAKIQRAKEARAQKPRASSGDLLVPTEVHESRLRYVGSAAPGDVGCRDGRRQKSTRAGASNTYNAAVTRRGGSRRDAGGASAAARHGGSHESSSGISGSSSTSVAMAHPRRRPVEAAKAAHRGRSWPGLS